MNCNLLIKWIAYCLKICLVRCECCGIPIPDTSRYCLTCYYNTCSECLICTYNCSWYRDDYCLICLAKEEYSFTKEQQERLEMIYSIGGFQYNQAKAKIHLLSVAE
jgi:hypothetical protein